MRKVFYTSGGRVALATPGGVVNDDSDSELETDIEQSLSPASGPGSSTAQRRKVVHRRSESMDPDVYAGPGSEPGPNKRLRRPGNPIVRQRQVSRDIRDATGQRPLQKACSRGDVVRVRQLLSEKPDLEDRDYAGTTALHTASVQGHAEIVKELIRAGAVIDVRSGPEELDTPLVDAVANGNRDVVVLLLKAGADPRVTNAVGRIALDFVDSQNNNGDADADADAILTALIARTKELRRKGIPVIDSPDDKRAPPGLFPPGFVSVQRPAAPVFLDVSKRSARAEIVEHAAMGHLEYVGSALERGWRPNAEALVKAARYGHTEVVGLLLAFGLGADQEYDGTTALQEAIKRGHLATVKLLVDSGAKLSSTYAKYVSDLPTWDLLRAYVLKTEPTPRPEIELSSSVPRIVSKPSMDSVKEENVKNESTGRGSEHGSDAHKANGHHTYSEPVTEPHKLGDAHKLSGSKSSDAKLSDARKSSDSKLSDAHKLSDSKSSDGHKSSDARKLSEPHKSNDSHKSSDLHKSSDAKSSELHKSSDAHKLSELHKSSHKSSEPHSTHDSHKADSHKATHKATHMELKLSKGDLRSIKPKKRSKSGTDSPDTSIDNIETSRTGTGERLKTVSPAPTSREDTTPFPALPEELPRTSNGEPDRSMTPPATSAVGHAPESASQESTAAAPATPASSSEHLNLAAKPENNGDVGRSDNTQRLSDPSSSPGSATSNNSAHSPKASAGVKWAERSQELTELAQLKEKQRKDREAKMLETLTQTSRRRSISGSIPGSIPGLPTPSTVSSPTFSGNNSTLSSADSNGSSNGTAHGLTSPHRDAHLPQPYADTNDTAKGEPASLRRYSPGLSPRSSPVDLPQQENTGDAQEQLRHKPAPAWATASEAMKFEPGLPDAKIEQVSVSHLPWALRRMAYTGKPQAVLPLLIHEMAGEQYFVDIQVALALGDAKIHAKYPDLTKAVITPQQKRLLWPFCRPWLNRPGESGAVAAESRRVFSELHLCWVSVSETLDKLFTTEPPAVRIQLDTPASSSSRQGSRRSSGAAGVSPVAGAPGESANNPAESIPISNLPLRWQHKLMTSW